MLNVVLMAQEAQNGDVPGAASAGGAGCWWLGPKRVLACEWHAGCSEHVIQPLQEATRSEERNSRRKRWAGS